MVLLALWASQPAAAQASAICETLRARLASQPVVIGNSREVQRYSSAITRQNFEIRKARQDLQRMGCGGGSIVIYGSNGRDACGELSSALRRMEDNKQILTSKRDSLQAGRADGGMRSRLLADLQTYGCSTEATRDTVSTPRPLEGPRQPRSLTPEIASRDGLSGEFVPPQHDLRQGQLRTLCVSTCDGSFFPISSNASPLNFRRDAQQCNQMCPGSETELYYHSLMTQESADMVSAETGEPYRDLPKAFSYLNRSPGEKSACGCNMADYHRRVLEAQKQSKPAERSYSSITEIRGTMEPVTKAAAQPVLPPERSYDPQSDNVRRVGPAFLPSETSSIDLKNPATPGPQPLQQ